MPPRFSILTPVHDPPRMLLHACIASISAQTYRDWELCLVDDGSRCASVRGELRRTVAADSRVRLQERPRAGGIVAALNDALAMATGEFVVLVGHVDRVEPDALARVDEALLADPLIDYVYTDEDKFAVDDSVYEVFHKPDWSPERLRAQNYCAHLSVLRRALIGAVGGFRPGFEGAHEYDLILRVTEQARRIHHVPAVLYHRYVTPGSAADEQAAKSASEAAGRRAVVEHLARSGIAGTVEHQTTPGNFRVRRTLSTPVPRASVVIPTVGTSRPVWGVTRTLVLDAVRSLLDVTDYPNLEVVVVVDPATPPGVVSELERLDVSLARAEGSFNYSRWCNQGVASSSGEHVVLLNDDVLIEQPDWLEVMVGFLADSDVGVVGARLLFADGTLQHAGILLNAQPLHIFRGFAGDDPGPFGLLQLDREVSAVTGACLATPREVWDELGGLDEDFPVAFNDVDYCLRARRTGRRVVWTPHASLYHFESQTRRGDADGSEIERLYSRWHDELHHDPYGNPNFAPHQAVWLPVDATPVGVLRTAYRRLRAARRA
jgi:GT2 family glycosyltransferase